MDEYEKDLVNQMINKLLRKKC